MSLATFRESGLLIQADPDGGSFTTSGARFFHVAEGWDLDLGMDMFKIQHNTNIIGERMKKMLPTLKGTLLEFSAANLPTLFPNLTANLGSRLVGATDVAFKFITPSGRQWLIPRGAVTKRPMLKPVVGQPLLGEFELTMLYSPTTSNHYTYTEEETHPGYASFDQANVLTLNPSVDYGSGSMNELYPTDGVEISFDWDLLPVLSGQQVIDYTISGQTIAAKCAPLTDANFAAWETKIGANLAPGSEIPVATFSTYYNGFYVELNNAQCAVSKFQFHHAKDFVEGITATAMQRYSGGSAVSLAYVGTSD